MCLLSRCWPATWRGLSHGPSGGDKARLDRFEQQVESVRGRLKIPGLSVAIVKDQELLWAKGFGFADLENRAVSTGGQRLPYGLGWFVTDYHGLKLVWHSGQWGTGFSAMYLKVPEKHVSVVMLANSEALAEHGGEDLARNSFVCSFLGAWGLGHDCERSAQAELVKWIAHRRAIAPVAVRVDPKVLESH